jgi:hypothetical protein
LRKIGPEPAARRAALLLALPIIALLVHGAAV